MKKFSSLLVAAAMLLGLTAPAYAWSTHTKSIPSVRITVNLNDLEIGDELSDNAETYITVPDNEYYTLDDAEWIDEVYSLKVGDQPRMRVYLSAVPKETSGNNYDTVWLFQNSYNTGNVRIGKGEFISADRRDSGYALEVTLRINPVNGQYSAPIDAFWTDNRGMGKWDPDARLKALGIRRHVHEGELKVDGAVKKVQESAPFFEDRGFILLLGQLVVDVLELDGLRIVIFTHTTDPVREHPVKGN